MKRAEKRVSFRVIPACFPWERKGRPQFFRGRRGSTILDSRQKHSGMTQVLGICKIFFSVQCLLTLFCACVLTFFAPLAVHAIVTNQTNVLGNESFELALGGSGNWDNTPGRAISNPSITGAVDGAHVLRLGEITGGSYTFQTVTGVKAGDYIGLSIYARRLNSDGTNCQFLIEFQTSAGALISSTVPVEVTSSSFMQHTTGDTAPAGTGQIVYVLRLNGGVATGGTTIGEFDAAVGTVSSLPIIMDSSASKPNLTKGSATFISNRMKNISGSTLNNVQMVVTVPEGFVFIDSASRLDGTPINSTKGSRIFSIGSIGGFEYKDLGFLLVASQAVQIGKRYEVSFYARDSVAGTVLSNIQRMEIVISADPFFDEGTILGKVFDDKNENAVQDKGEDGISGVKIATEEGIVVVTDPRGRYHIPAIKPGRHVVKIDGHTLPKNTKFVSEESVLIKTTNGMMNVVNFAAKLPESKIPESHRDKLKVMVTQGTDFEKPELAVTMQPEVLRMGVGVFEEDPRFIINTNYGELIAGWRIEVTDQFGEKVWAGYGLGVPPAEAPWTGKKANRDPVEKGIYAYRLVVRDKEGHEDWTPLRYFRVVSKLDSHVPDHPDIQVPAAGNMVINRDGKRSIPINAKPKVLIRGTTQPWNTVAVNGEQATVHLDGTFSKEIYVPPGKQSVTVTTTDQNGNAVSYQEDVDVKDTMFFMVGLGEQEMGANFLDGNLEALGRDEKFHQGFYQDGRLAYYLKAKIKGKFLVTSRYDTDDPRTAFFTNLDPDQYYPVYGDDSQIQYDGETANRFYILAEMDRSYLKWGSFSTNFTDTELASHNRTFSGLKIHYETLAMTRYGDAKRGFAVYTANVKQLGDHNEFIGTGGSLFYLRNKNVIQGSEKVRVEVRDSIQNIPVYSKDLVYGTDYEIDYPQGRIILRKPLSAVSFSDYIISNDILNGSDTYLLVDYEFDPQGEMNNGNNGIRGYTHLGDHFRVGGTAIEDRQPGKDYDLRGVDLTGKFGKNTKIMAEYARSQGSTNRNAISYNGGITFTDMPTGEKLLKKPTRLFDDAYAVKAQTKLITGTDVSGYVQRMDPGFSNADSISQAGLRKAGLEMRHRVGENVELRYRFDDQKATDPGNSAEIFTESPSKGQFHTAQMKADYDNYLGAVEYRYQNISTYESYDRYHTNEFDSSAFKNALGAKLGYKLSEGVMPYVKGQGTWDGQNGANNQFGGGLESDVMGGKGRVRVEEMVGNVGDATTLGFNMKTSETTDAYTTIQTGPDPEHLNRNYSTTIGSSTQLDSKSRFYSERELSSYRVGDREANILGYDRQLSERWSVGANVERGRLREISDVDTDRTAGAVEVSYLDREFLKIISRYELRYDRGGPTDRIQFLFRDTVDWKINEDFRYSAQLNRGDSIALTNVHKDGLFTEFNTGLAYRPVANNRLNVLTRYTWLENIGADSQFDTPDIFGIGVDESAHIFGLEFGYDALPPYLSVTEKLGYRRSLLTAEGDTHEISNYLWATRFNFHVIRKWDLIAEYRLFWDFEMIQALKHGLILEIDRELMDYVHFGIGYNFSDFTDDLQSLNNYDHHGLYTRLSGKF